MTTLPTILRRCLTGFVAGWLVGDLHYYITFVIIRDDAHFFLTRRDIGAMTSGSAILAMFFVFFSLALGTVFLIKPLHQWWLRAGNWVIILSVAGAAAILLEGQFCLTNLSLIWAFFYLLMIFPIVNWP